LWVSTLKILRLVGLAVLMIAVVVPRATRAARPFVGADFAGPLLRASLEVSRDRPGMFTPSSGDIKPEEFLHILAGAADIVAVVTAAFGSIYPLIVLVVLSRSSARAAFATRAEPLPDITSRPDPGQ
jgi:hypothetical protein